MEIVINSVSEFDLDVPLSIIHRSLYLEWPGDVARNAGSFGTNHYCCRSVRKLTLVLNFGHAKWPLIQAVFPNIRILELKESNTTPLGLNPIPFADVFKLWPNLEELKVAVEKNLLGWNYDADLCGIYEREAEMLRERVDDDVGFLQNVHVVPIKPSVLTMSCKFWFVCVAVSQLALIQLFTPVNSYLVSSRSAENRHPGSLPRFGHIWERSRKLPEFHFQGHNPCGNQADTRSYNFWRCQTITIIVRPEVNTRIGWLT